MSKVAQKAKEATKKKGSKGADSDNNDDEGSDSYRAILRALRADNRAKPSVCSFEDCAKCVKQCTVVCPIRSSAYL